MQAARLKAESQGRKAKVWRKYLPIALYEHTREAEGLTLCHSLPIHTMSYWSTCNPSATAPEPKLTCDFLQRVRVERSAIGWQLLSGTFDRKGIFWEGLSCYAQAHEWLQSKITKGVRGVSADSRCRLCSNLRTRTTRILRARSIIIVNLYILI